MTPDTSQMNEWINGKGGCESDPGYTGSVKQENLK